MQRDHEYHALELANVVEETADARSFVLEVPPALAERFAYRAGQFCTFRATIDGEAVARCYSMSSSPEAGEPLTVTVKRVAGGRMSNWMNDRLAPGDMIDVLVPAGMFVLRAAEEPIVAFAGGSGITPVVSIVKTALLTTTREIVLVYANRDAQSVIFAETFDALRAEWGDRLRLHHHLDSESGFLDAAACAEFIGDRIDADFYVCGPGPFLAVVEAGLAERGVDPDRVFIERFVDPDTSPAAPVASETESLVVRIRGRKHEINYMPGESILHAARRAGLKPPSACEAGACGTCMALVVEGRVTMRVNNALEPDEVEEGYILTCQATPVSREVVVDYEA
jgi:3-ketosteroid 9alpha-monooxygenase subunit B